MTELNSSTDQRKLRWYSDQLTIFTMLAVFVIDQLTKFLVKSRLDLYESWPQDGLVRITYGTKYGTAFGLFPNQTSILIVASIFAIGFIYYFYKSQGGTGYLLRTAIGLQLGGAFGNLLDRVRLGSVVDFIDVGWWPIFNVADSSIVVGISILVFVMFLGSSNDSKTKNIDENNKNDSSNKLGPTEESDAFSEIRG